MKDCAHANRDEMIRDSMVFGIRSPVAREMLLSVGSELTLDEAMHIARSHETAKAQIKREEVVHTVSQPTSSKNRLERETCKDKEKHTQ